VSTPGTPDTPQEQTSAPRAGHVRGWSGLATIGKSVGAQLRLSRRSWTVLLSFVIVAALGLVGGFVRVPYVALGPGPTFDTLGEVDGVPVVQIEGQQTYPTSGQLRLTTVSPNRDVTLFGALGLWISGRYALAPREEYIRPGETEEEVEQQNVRMFQDSQSNAEVAALRQLGYPVKVIAGDVTKGAPADAVIQPGDRLVVINGKTITRQEDVRGALEGTTPGQTIPITIQRGDKREDVSLTLGRAADFGAEDRAQGFMGLSPVDRTDVPFKITIHLEDVGGPSAGLMFALAIIDQLTPGEMEAGQTFAGSGEIDANGNVGPIGGINFKLVAAAEAGATTFLVPAANCPEAKERAPEGLRLIKVENLAGAMRALEDLKAGRPVPDC
jgi:PDZ domain-containing protein